MPPRYPHLSRIADPATAHSLRLLEERLARLRTTLAEATSPDLAALDAEVTALEQRADLLRALAATPSVTPAPGAAPGTPGAPGPSGPLPPLPTGRVFQTNFLSMPPIFGMSYPGATDSERQEFRDNCVERGYDSIVCVTTNADSSIDAPYDHLGHPERFTRTLDEAEASGLVVAAGFGFEDAPGPAGFYTPANLRDIYLPNFLAVNGTHPAMRAYWLGVEVNEYWTVDDVQIVGSELRRLTGKPIYVHCNGQEWAPAGRHLSDAQYKAWWLNPAHNWCTGLFFQYGKEATVAEVASRTAYLVGQLHALGRQFVASEYGYPPPFGDDDEVSSAAKGDAAMAAGADGFTNGGTAT